MEEREGPDDETATLRPLTGSPLGAQDPLVAPVLTDVAAEEDDARG